MRQVVEAHGGEVKLVSAVGAGSTFALWLPAADQIEVPTPSAVGREPVVPAAPAPLVPGDLPERPASPPPMAPTAPGAGGTP